MGGLLPRAEGAATAVFLSTAVGAAAWSYLGKAISPVQAVACVTAWVWLQRLCASGFATWTVLPLWHSGPSLAGKVFVVTGANTGIGYWTAAQLHRQGATVVITTRKEAVGRATVTSLRNVSGGTAPIHALRLELGDPESVKAFPAAYEALRLGAPITCLINNAGAFGYPAVENTDGSVVTVESRFDGVELTMGCNALGPWLLSEKCRRLLDPKHGRVVFLGSAAHRIVKTRAALEEVLAAATDKQALQSGEVPSLGKQFELYGVSKYVNIVNARVFWKRHQIPAASVHPGVVLTDFARNMPAIFGVLMKNPVAMALLSLLGKTSYEGALTTVRCATAPSIANGHYYADQREHNGFLSPAARDVANDAPIVEWVRNQLAPHLPTA